MELLKKVIHILSSIIYILVFAYGIVWLPSIFGYKPLIVLSKSMEPTYKEGTVIYYHQVPKDEIKIGDIITFKGNKNELISHRVKSMENDLFITKGDANEVNDANKVKYEDIYGKNIDIMIIYIGYFIKFVNNHGYLIILACIILVMDFLLSNYNKKEDQNEK